jgi:hypothetical protein
MKIRMVIIHDARDEITSLKRLLMQEGYEVVAFPLKMGQNEQVSRLDKGTPPVLEPGECQKARLINHW